MSSISLHEEVQGETLEANAQTFKWFLCLYENEYLVCKAKNSSNGFTPMFLIKNTHVSWSLQSYENAFIQTSLLMVTPKILLKTKCSPSQNYLPIFTSH
jgi:mRNA deadenylase 3'-5' endonuclease subunit Ccr4